MKLFKEIPNDVALAASKKILGIKAGDLVERFIEVFGVTAELASHLRTLSSTGDSPKLRHWLSVSRSMIRSRINGLDPEPQFIAHFLIDSMEPGRLAELHALRGIELLLDDALRTGKSITLDLSDIRSSPRFHVWLNGTAVLRDNHIGMRFEATESGEFTLRFGSVVISSANMPELISAGTFHPDILAETSAGRVVFASNIQGLGDAYHSNAPVVRGTPALSEWAAVFRNAVDLLGSLDREVARDCVGLSKAVCPLHCGGTTFGSSSPADVIGLVFLPGVSDPYDVAECFLHESLHQKLYHAEEGSPLFAGENGDEEIYYSPWRPDGRPLRMLVHGSYVFTGVAQMWRAIAEESPDASQRDRALFHVHYRSGQALRAIDVIQKYGQLTSFGQTVVDIISDGVAESRDGVRFANYYARESDKRQDQHFEAHSILVH